MDNWERSDERSLPNKESFYSNLNMENIDDIDYRHGNNVFKRFKLIGELMKICRLAPCFLRPWPERCGLVYSRAPRLPRGTLRIDSTTPLMPRSQKVGGLTYQHQPNCFLPDPSFGCVYGGAPFRGVALYTVFGFGFDKVLDQGCVRASYPKFQFFNRATLLNGLAPSTDYRIIDFDFDFSSCHRQLDMLVADLLAYVVCATFPWCS